MEDDGFARDRDGRFRALFLVALAVYFATQTGLRLLWPGALEFDDAGQVVASQSLEWGYGAQPPLYTWLYIAFERVLGYDLLALALLKNLLLLSCFAACFLAAERLLDTRRAAVATAGLFLIPYVLWTCQRNLTHTPLAMALVATTLLQFAWLVRTRTTARYLLLGLCLGLGTLAKTNFPLFLAALLIAAATLPEGRRVLADRRMLAAAIVALAVVSPHALWFHENHAQALASKRFLVSGPASSGWVQLARLAVALAVFAGPFLVVAGLLFPRALLMLGKRAETFAAKLLRRYLAIVLLLVCAALLAFRPYWFRPRWLLPLLLLGPVRYFAGVDAVSGRAARRFLCVCGVVALAAGAGLAARAPLAPHVGGFSRLNHPYAEFARRIREAGFREGVILGSAEHVTGNLLRQFEGSHAACPNVLLPRVKKLAATRDILVVWEETDMPPWLPGYVQEQSGVDIAGRAVQRLELPRRHGDGWAALEFVVVRRAR